MEAAQKGDSNKIKKYVEKGYNIDLTNDADETSLFLACEAGHINIVKYLLDKGANANVWDCIGQSPISVTSRNQHIDILKLLIERGADPDSNRRCGYTPLFDAISSYKPIAIKALLKGGANPNKRSHGELPLISAAEKGYLDIIRILIEHGAKKSKNCSKEMLLKASENGCLNVVQFLIEEWNLSASSGLLKGKYKNSSPLQMAVKNGHIKVVEYLLDKGADMEQAESSSGYTALCSAVCQRDLKMVQLLLKRGANPNGYLEYQQFDNNSRMVTPISLAVSWSEEDVVDMAKSNAKNVDIVKALIEYGANPDIYMYGVIAKRVKI